MEIFALCVAGVLGTLSRHYANVFVHGFLDRERFPLGTLVVNILGSFLMGLIMELGVLVPAFPKSLRLAMTVGFLGAFTTFSAFSHETVTQLENRMWGTTILVIAANVIGSVLACWLGIQLVRLAISKN